MLAEQLEPMYVATEQVPTGIFWCGNSFLLRCVVNIITKQFGPVSSVKTFKNHVKPIDGLLIHDGHAPESVRKLFALDFNIANFGQMPDAIVENLSKKLFSGLV